jgi:hypothetical protein
LDVQLSLVPVRVPAEVPSLKPSALLAVLIIPVINNGFVVLAKVRDSFRLGERVVKVNVLLEKTRRAL